MNKKSIFKAKAYKEPKAKITKVAKPKTKSFKAEAQVVEIEDPQKEIDKQVAEMKKQKEEAVLLEAELEKPFEDRNKNLMRKYGYVDGVNKLDAYPDFSGDQKYRIKVFIPEDPLVNKNLRPKPWYVKLELKHDGNEFTFRFPISRSSVLEDETSYQLDNLPVWVDEKGHIINNISEYTIYQALYDYVNNIKDNEEEQQRVFLEYGVKKAGSNELDFRIRNRGFGVTFTKIKETAASKKPPKKAQESSGNEHFSSFSIYEKISYWGSPQKVADSVINRIEKTPKLRKFAGLDSGITFDENNLILDHVITGKSLNPDAFYCMLTSWDKDTGIFGFAIINGILSITKIMTDIKKTRVGIEEYIAKTNEWVYKGYKDGVHDVEDIFQ